MVEPLAIPLHPGGWESSPGHTFFSDSPQLSQMNQGCGTNTVFSLRKWFKASLVHPCTSIIFSSAARAGPPPPAHHGAVVLLLGCPYGVSKILST